MQPCRMAHRTAAQDICEGLLCSTSIKQKEQRRSHCTRWEEHRCTYLLGPNDNYRKKRLDPREFFFCSDNIERCVKGRKMNWVVSVPPIPEVWPVKLGTNLTCKEILSSENAGFRLPLRKKMTPSQLFQDHLLPLDLASYTTPEFPDEFPTRRSRKLIRRNNKAPSTKHANNCASALSLNAKVHKLCMLPAPAFGYIVTLDSGTPPKVQQYYLTILHMPACTCPNFKEMATKAIGKGVNGPTISICTICLM